MYRLALRISEVANYARFFKHAIELQDVQLFPANRGIHITLRSFKHGDKTKKYVLKAGEKFYAYFVNFIKLRGKASGQLFIHQNGNNFTRQFIISVLRADLQSLGLPAKNYNTHSFRIGKTCDMAADGLSDRQIAELGRWSSNAFLKYIRPSVIQA